MKDFPFARAWFYRDVYRGWGWLFGFYFAPWPREEHREGEMIRALCHVDGFVSFKPWQFRIWLWTADPAHRPIGITHTVGG